MSTGLNRLLQSFEKGLPKKIGAQFAYQKLSPSLWKKVKQFNQNDDPSATPEKRLIKFFALGRNDKQRAFLGSLMYEQGLRLPLRYEIRLIESLLRQKDPQSALNLWQSRSPLKKPYHDWDVLGVKCLLACNRIADAEFVAANMEFDSDPAVAVEFAYSYSRIPDAGERLEHWLQLIPFSKRRRFLPSLIRNRHAELARQVILNDPESFTAKTGAISTALKSSEDAPDRASFVSALAKKPELVNVPVFREAWNRAMPDTDDPVASEKAVAMKASELLAKNKVDKALELLSHCNSRIYVVFLRHCAERRDMKTLDKVISHAKSHMAECLSKTGQESRYVYFLIKSHLVKLDYDAAIATMSNLKLDTPDPLFRLDYRVYKLIWSTLRRGAKRKLPSMQEISARILLANMYKLANCPIDVRTLEDIVFVFESLNDMAGALAACRIGEACIPGFKIPEHMTQLDSPQVAEASSIIAI